MLSKTVGQGIKVFAANAKSVWCPLIAATLRMPPIPRARLKGIHKPPGISLGSSRHIAYAQLPEGRAAKRV